MLACHHISSGPQECHHLSILDPAMDSDYSLQENISNAISKFIHCRHERYNRYGDGDEPLSATPSELIVMALVDMQRPASSKEIELHITRRFRLGYRVPQGRDLYVIYGLIQSGFDIPLLEVPPVPAVDTLNPGHRLFESDTQLFRDRGLSEQEIFVQRMSAAHPPAADRSLAEVRWTTHIRDAALFLRRRLLSPWTPGKHFPIMKLPVELREWIFKYALLLPPGAVMKHTYAKHCSGRWAITAPRWHSPSKPYYVEAKFFALLRVSKAFYQEAQPHIWSQNLLVSGTAPMLGVLLRPTMRWKYINQIELQLEGYLKPGKAERKMMVYEDECIAVLAGMPRLRKLVVCLTRIPQGWKKCKREHDLWVVPGIMSVRKHVRGLRELVVHGVLEEYEDSLRAELMGPRQAGCLESRH